MSADNSIEAETADICASCGNADDKNNLKKCNVCDLVRYCSDTCQREHSQQHEQACKERVAELRDEILFKQSESSHLGDCPICLLPLPLYHDEFTLMGCCSKIICRGCEIADRLREKEANLHHACPFCRHPIPETEEESDKDVMKRVEKNDPVAMTTIGRTHYERGEYGAAFEYYTKAAELGDVDAHNHLSILYRDGEGVEKDEKKELYHLEVAAIAGHLDARHNLGCYEGGRGRFERGVKHHIIAANLGLDESIEMLMKLYEIGQVSMEDLSGALSSHRAAVAATESPQREEALYWETT
eukprot:scaffold682_cov105-Skeletonema_dohrnii-CCMP3373.AAC.18